MRNPLQKMKIGTSLLLIVVVMMVLMLASSYLIFAHYDAAIIGEIQDQTESLSKALQISVQQLTSQDTTSDSLLADYVERLSSKGVREISILSNEKEVVASSNQARVGKKLPPAKGALRKGDLVISGTLGDDEALEGGGKITEELDIPIVVNNEKRGYIRLHLLLDDLDALIH